MEQSILTAIGLQKRYHNSLALDNVTIDLPKGRIIGLLGPNGSGKTTFLKLAAGLLTPTAGSLTIDGQPIGPQSKALVSYLPDRPCFSRESKILDLVTLFGDFYADFQQDRAMEMLTQLDIDPEARFRQLSKGNQEKVQLILVMARRARLYLLDEPIGGVDPAAREYILNTIICNYEPDSTVLISTHLISDVERVLDDYIFLHKGRILQHGSAEAVREESGKSLDQLFREVFVCLPN